MQFISTQASVILITEVLGPNLSIINKKILCLIASGLKIVIKNCKKAMLPFDCHSQP